MPGRLKVFENFDWDGLNVIMQGQKEVAKLERGYFGTEAILLGSLAAGGKAGCLLNEFGVQIENVRASAQLIDPEKTSVPVNIPFTSGCKTVLIRAVEIANTSKEQPVNDLVLLKSLLLQPESRLEPLLANIQLNIESLLEKIDGMLASSSAEGRRNGPPLPSEID